jgi:hypothetical protein
MSFLFGKKKTPAGIYLFFMLIRDEFEILLDANLVIDYCEIQNFCGKIRECWTNLLER